MAPATMKSSQDSLEDAHFPMILKMTLAKAMENTIQVYKITSQDLESLDK